MKLLREDSYLFILIGYKNAFFDLDQSLIINVVEDFFLTWDIAVHTQDIFNQNRTLDKQLIVNYERAI